MQSYFYATKNDMMPVLSGVETHCELQYVVSNHSPTANFAAFKYDDLPNLGIASDRVGVGCTQYLVLRRDVAVIPMPIQYNEDVQNGALVYTAGPHLNPESVMFTPAGIWSGNTILRGSVGTAFKNEFSLLVMKLFRKYLRKYFTCAHQTFIGAQAKQMHADGMRLTMGANCPPEYDFVIPAV